MQVVTPKLKLFRVRSEIVADVTANTSYYIKIESYQSNFSSEDYNFTTNFYPEKEEDTSPTTSTINGTPYDDTIQGTDNDDLIDPDSGNDIVKGGKGSDTVIMNISSDAIEIRSPYTFSGYNGIFTGENAGKYSSQYKRLFNVEKLKL